MLYDGGPREAGLIPYDHTRGLRGPWDLACKRYHAGLKKEGRRKVLRSRGSEEDLDL